MFSAGSRIQPNLKGNFRVKGYKGQTLAGKSQRLGGTTSFDITDNRI
jgi:hypothetical protein